MASQLVKPPLFAIFARFQLKKTEMKKVLLLLTLLTIGVPSWAQKKQDVLLTIDKTPIYASEFERVYNKNLDLVQDENQKTVDGYLDLFIDYKLKVAEAKAQGLDKKPVYVQEFGKYQNQLSRNYIYEGQLTEQLAKEAYDRSLEEIHASHILVLSSYDDAPQDTLIAYNKIKNIWSKAKAGGDFTALAKQFSEEPGAKERGGDLGYFSAFSMVYPFETMAYQTEEGAVSDIVRTSFGYHIIKVHDRRIKEGEVLAAHIMVSTESGERTFDPEERIREINSLLQQGESFESLAKQYSDDKASAKNGGKLRRFGRGGLRAKKFEEKVYTLEVGETSEPFKSNYGWHIIRLLDKFEIESFEQQKEQLMKRTAQGERSKIVTSSVNKTIKEKYGYKQNEAYVDYFNAIVADTILQRKWTYEPLPSEENTLLFNIGDREVYYADFAQYLSAEQRRGTREKTKEKYIAVMYDNFETKILKEYLIEKLEEENKEYAAIISEYRDGLLIFDVMNENIWTKAKNDSVALQQYYEANKASYNWDTRVDAIVVSSADKMMAQQAKELLAQGKDASEIKTFLNTDGKVNVIVTAGTFEKGARELPTNYTFNTGVSEIYAQENQYVVVHAKQVLAPAPKEFDAVRGRVISGYQAALEKRWLQQLREKYVVTVDKKTLKKLRKKLDK